MTGISDILFIEDNEPVLRRRYIKNGKFIKPYMSCPLEAKIVLKGIGAYMFRNSCEDKIKLPVLLDSTNIESYFKNYFHLQKKLFLEKANNNPSLIFKNKNKIFISKHLKLEKSYLKDFFNIYAKDFTNKKECVNRKKYIEAYLKWLRREKSEFRKILEKLKKISIFIVKLRPWSF